ncbi:hypothetical protein FKW77_010024 [Venturia effusa]|uniref:Uncharacterized protein n=1 Tax=Venturia effusa TaxID=50376 RepID=A0A517KXH6_9PEZI|nr:hypothetical protein FKW77_010024 [Venturia effusa]
MDPATTGTDDTSSTASRDRSTSFTSASQNTRTSLSCDERKDRKHKKKPSAFKSFFAVKEPSAVAFQNLAQAMKEEMEEKGQRPFGVPSGKIPASAESDYKKAKEKAKEMARLHLEAKERQKKAEEHEKAMAHAFPAPNKKGTIIADNRKNELQETAEALSYVSLDPRPSTSSYRPSALPIPLSGRQKSTSSSAPPKCKAPSLNSLPETAVSISSISSAQSSPPPSMPVTPCSPFGAPPSEARAEIAPWEVGPVQSTSAGPKKADVAPWEDDEEEEFPIRKGAKKSKGYFSTLIRR